MVATHPDAFRAAARFTIKKMVAGGQTAAPTWCALLSTSAQVLGDMQGGSQWKVTLDVRDLGGHLGMPTVVRRCHPVGLRHRMR